MQFIKISPGHGAYDAGAVAYGRQEKHYNLEFAKRLSAELTKRGYRVLQQRTDDSICCDKNGKPNNSRAWFEAAPIADLGISVHFNAFAPEKATGTETWVFFTDPVGRDLAAKLSAAIANTLGIPNRGAKNGTVYISKACRTIQLEICFFDRTSDMEKYGANIDRLVSAVANTIDAHFGNIYQPEPILQPEPEPVPTPVPNPVPVVTEIKAGDMVTLNGPLYRTSGGAGETKPYSNRKATVTRIISEAVAGYLLDNGNMGWAKKEHLSGGSVVQAPAPSPAPAPSARTRGATVSFKGGYHYANANAALPSGLKRKAGTAQITNIAPGSKHPYHLVGSTVYGLSLIHIC